MLYSAYDYFNKDVVYMALAHFVASIVFMFISVYCFLKTILNNDQGKGDEG